LFVADLPNSEVGTVANWGLQIDAKTQAGTVSVPDAGSTLTLLSIAFAALIWSARRRVTV
jgi:VPDSG-CTERM motif